MSKRPFPAFLSTVFDEAALEQSGATIAIIEPTGEILWVSSSWERFANENGGDPGVGDQPSYFLGIAPPLRSDYERVFAQALQTGEVFTQDYECSSPDTRRLFHLRVLPILGRVLMIEHTLVAESAHGPGTDAPPEAYRDANGIIHQCSNCRRVRRPSGLEWDWVPALIERMDPATSHGLCPSCLGFYWGLDDLTDG